MKKLSSTTWWRIVTIMSIMTGITIIFHSLLSLGAPAPRDMTGVEAFDLVYDEEPVPEEAQPAISPEEARVRELWDKLCNGETAKGIWDTEDLLQKAWKKLARIDDMAYERWEPVFFMGCPDDPAEMDAAREEAFAEELREENLEAKGDGKLVEFELGCEIEFRSNGVKVFWYDCESWYILNKGVEYNLLDSVGRIGVNGMNGTNGANGANGTNGIGYIYVKTAFTQLAEARAMYDTWRAETSQNRILMPGILLDDDGKEHPFYFYAFYGEVSLPEPQLVKAIQLDSQSRCPECRKEGEISIVTEGELDIDDSLPATKTFYGVDGKSHLHGSRLFRNYLCSSGHQWREMLCRTCWCGWVYPDDEETTP